MTPWDSPLHDSAHDIKIVLSTFGKEIHNRFGALREKGERESFADEVVPYDCARRIGLLDPEIELRIG